MTVARTLPAQRVLDSFRHEALFYAGLHGFIEGTTPFIGEALDADGPILVVVGEEKIDALQRELGADARRVTFADVDRVDRNPARIIPAWRDFLDAQGSGGQRVWGIGEPISSKRRPDELVECQRHESLLNLAFADAPAWRLLCPYDTVSLTTDVLHEAFRSHPYVWESGCNLASAGFRGLASIASPFARPLPEPPRNTDRIPFTVGDLPAVRVLVALRAEAFGLAQSKRDAIVLALNEVATNSLRHAGGCGELLVWNDGDSFTCEVRDRGRIATALAGRVRPAPGQEGGLGLWIANQVCDLVQIRSFEDGSAVRLHMSRG